jgi:hypothetical protein
MRLLLTIDYDGTLPEFFAALPSGVDVLSFQRLSLDQLQQQFPKISSKIVGSVAHMDAQIIAEINAGFDAGKTIEQLTAQTGFSYRSIAGRRKKWKLLRKSC